jgi:hypothetical protein
MAYTALQLVTRAFYLSQIVSRDLQVPSASQITDGLYLLNAILDFKRTDLREIPYYRQYDFDTVQGQEKYNVPGLLTVDSMTFNIGPVRYSMAEQTRVGYFGQYRIDNVESLPYEYRMERTLDGTDVYMYFVPSQIFKMKIWGKFGLNSVDLTTNMSDFYDLLYRIFKIRISKIYLR